MDHPAVVVLLTLVALAVVKWVYLFAVGKGSVSRVWTAWALFNKVMGDADAAKKAQAILTTPPPEPAKPPRLSGEPLKLLVLLQREGRLLDFLLEDISGADDAQVGAGVRELHKKSQAALKEHLTLEPIMPGQEGATVKVPAGFDPSAVTLTGNVTGSPPFDGVLKHHGWRARAYKLPTPPQGVDDLVVAPAEVELP